VQNPDSETRLNDTLKDIMMHKVNNTKSKKAAKKIVKKWIVEVDAYRTKQTAEWKSENPDHTWSADELNGYNLLMKIPDPPPPSAESTSESGDDTDAYVDAADTAAATAVSNPAGADGKTAESTEGSNGISDSDDEIKTPPVSPIAEKDPTPKIIAPSASRVPSPAFSDESSASSPGSTQHDTPNVVLSTSEKENLEADFNSCAVAADFDERIQRLSKKLSEDGTDATDMHEAVNSANHHGFTPLENVCMQALPKQLFAHNKFQLLAELDERKLSAVKILVEQCGSRLSSKSVGLACSTGSTRTLSFLLGDGSEAAGLTAGDTQRMITNNADGSKDVLSSVLAFCKVVSVKDNEPEPEEKDEVKKFPALEEEAELRKQTPEFYDANWDAVCKMTQLLLPLLEPTSELHEALKYVEKVGSVFQDLTTRTSMSKSSAERFRDHSAALQTLAKTEIVHDRCIQLYKTATLALDTTLTQCASATAALIASKAALTAEDKFYHANDEARNLRVVSLWQGLRKRAFDAEVEQRAKNGRNASVVLAKRVKHFREGIEQKRHEHVWGSVESKVKTIPQTIARLRVAGKSSAQEDVDLEEDDDEQMCEYFGQRWADLQLRFDQEAEAREMDECIAVAVEKHDTVRASDLSAAAPAYELGNTKTDLSSSGQSDQGGWLEETAEEAEEDGEEDEETCAWAETEIIAVNVEFTDKVLKWLRRCDSHYRSRAITRLQQLASGRRSYCLSKRLKTAESEGMPPLYETKLDQGQRIIWMSRKRAGTSDATTGDVDAIFVWFIAKHDAVQRAVQQIQKSYQRVNVHVKEDKERCLKQDGETQDSKSTICAYNCVNQEDYLLNPEGNSPLKVYTLLSSEFVPALSHKMEVDNFSKMFWQPPLRLAGDEDKVVREPTQSSKMLLGRSGTGKTLCAISAMAHDRQTHSMKYAGSTQSAMKQVFVARSQKLVNYVQAMLKSKRVIQSGAQVGVTAESSEGAQSNDAPLGIDQGPDKNTWFLKLPSMIRSLENWAGVQETFEASERVDADLFETDFWPTVKDSPTLLSATLSANDEHAALKQQQNQAASGAAGRRRSPKGSKGNSQDSGKAGLSLRPLVVWTNIRTFIKGSVEAVIKGEPLSFDEYTALGRSRVRISEDQRREVYCVYERYAEYLKKNKMWDEEDRVQNLIKQQIAQGGWCDPAEENVEAQGD
jgi:hypothetical protein